MQTYRVLYRAAGDGHIGGVGEFTAPDDASAISQAQLIESRHGIELWDRTRLIRVFPAFRSNYARRLEIGGPQSGLASQIS